MFERVLVANRGEIACRILGTCQRLGIESVAVFSDADAAAPHVALADQAFRLGSSPVQESYLNLDALREVIGLSGADAVHPGYGLLSENPRFAEAVADAGARFVGPSAQAMSLLGDKVRARTLARSVGLEPPPGTDSAVTPGEAGELASRVGYPLLVKAAAGGGGIGMQVVHEAAELDGALASAAARAKAAFGDDRVYLERYLKTPRHIELQLVRDSRGRSHALGERECSVQRRHQKILEESPSPASFLGTTAGAQRLAERTEQAKQLLDACDYEGVATVEFIADEQGDLYFLEVNTRLQVEHPLTEMRTGLDLVELQLLVAAGEPLPSAVSAPRFEGHAIEARLYAEDPYKKFMPQPGTIVRFELPSGEGVRVDSGVSQGYEVTPYYDPLLLKLIVWGKDRREASARLDRALGELVLEIEGRRGPRTTNQGFLRQVLASEAFAAGDYDTNLAEKLLDGRG